MKFMVFGSDFLVWRPVNNLYWMPEPYMNAPLRAKQTIKTSEEFLMCMCVCVYVCVCWGGGLIRSSRRWWHQVLDGDWSAAAWGETIRSQYHVQETPVHTRCPHPSGISKVDADWMRCGEVAVVEKVWMMNNRIWDFKSLDQGRPNFFQRGPDLIIWKCLSANSFSWHCF